MLDLNENKIWGPPHLGNEALDVKDEGSAYDVLE
jgi:hypothetical protein